MIHFRRPAGARLLVLAPAAIALVLAGCAGDSGPPDCPALSVPGDTAKLTRFRGGGRDLTDVVFEAAIERSALTCEEDDGAVEALVQVVFSVNRGPAEQDRRADFSYFVAIADREENILAREQFALGAEFEGNRTLIQLAEEIEPNIPLAEGKGARDYVVYIGLQLNRAEVEYNRRLAR